MLGVPGPSFVAAVPGRGERSDVVHVVLAPLDELDRSGRRVVPAVVGVRDAGQVGQVVVERIVVPMVDVMALRDWAVRRHPDLFVQPSDAALPVGLAGREVDPVAASCGVRVATEPDPLEDNDFGLGHVISLSPYRSASMVIHPRPRTQTRWFAVPSSVRPSEVVSLTTSADGEVCHASTTRRRPRRVWTFIPTATFSIGTGPCSVSTIVPATKQ